MIPSFAALSFRGKLIAAILSTSILTLLLTCLSLFLFEYAGSRHDLEVNVDTLAGVIADNSTAAIAFSDTNAAEQTLGALRAEKQIVSATLYDRDGAVFARFPADGSGALPPPEAGPPGLHMSGGRLVCIREVIEGNRRLGTLRIEASLSGVTERLRIYVGVVLAVLAVAVAIALIVAVALQRRIARPVLELVRTSRTVAHQNDYSLRVERVDHDELGELTQAFNDMLGKIQAGADASRRSAQEIQQLNSNLEQRVQERTAQLQEANQELESFSYSVSHDLRAPLRHVQGYAEMLERALNGQLSDKARRYLRVIGDASSEMGQLIDDLLAFSRVGRSEMRHDVVNMNDIVDQVRTRLDVSGRNVTWDIHPLPSVRADAAMLRVVMMNLIGNALKFTRTRTNAEVRIHCTSREDDRAVICVRDNGVGFDMAYYDKLFGVFQRLHSQEEFDGTGIGLATVRRVIARHGGSVWAESVVNKGAAFFFSLPVSSSTDSERT